MNIEKILSNFLEDLNLDEALSGWPHLSYEREEIDPSISYEDFQLLLEKTDLLRNSAAKHQIVITMQQLLLPRSSEISWTHKSDLLPLMNGLDCDSFTLDIQTRQHFIANLQDHDFRYLGVTAKNKWLLFSLHTEMEDWEDGPVFHYYSLLWVLKDDFTENLITLYRMGESTEEES